MFLQHFYHKSMPGTSKTPGRALGLFSNARVTLFKLRKRTPKIKCTISSNVPRHKNTFCHGILRPFSFGGSDSTSTSVSGPSNKPMQKKLSPESLDIDTVCVSAKVGDSACPRACKGMQKQKEHFSLPKNSAESANGVDRSQTKSAKLGSFFGTGRAFRKCEILCDRASLLTLYDVSVKIKAPSAQLQSSVAVSAEISLRSPQKL